MRRSFQRSLPGARGRRELPVESLVIATRRARRWQLVENEYRMIVELAHWPVSLVEVSAALDVPVTVVRTLVSELVAGGHVDVHPPPAAFAGDGPSTAVLARLLNGLRAR